MFPPPSCFFFCQRVGIEGQESDQPGRIHPSRELLEGKRLFSASRVKEMCFCSLDNCEDVRDPISPLVFQVTHRIPPSGICAHVFLSNRCRCSSGGRRESRRVANANVDEYNEHSQDVHRLHLLATVNDQIEQVLLVEPMVIQRT